jgi:nucleotide-binding universal stress UspA family protein/RimJ/RimL family protein N-acetyltransferase
VSAGAPVRRVQLRDGSQIAIRPIEPADREALAEGVRRLSPESRYRRFFATVPDLAARDLDYLTQVDHRDHEALVAIDADTGMGVGVARYVRTAPDAAEPAVAVADDWQGRGVATALLGALAARAREEGVNRFVAPVLAANADAIRVLERLGPATVRPLGREVEVAVDLAPEPAGTLALTAALRAFASDALTPARTLLDRVVPRRRGRLDAPRGNRIVVGTDGSEDACAAVEVALELARVLRAGVHVVGVHRLLLPDRDEVRDAVAQSATALRGAGLQVHEHLRRGDPGIELADVADEEAARLIVVGAGRRRLGSTADAVAQRAPCDVLIVRRGADG